MGTKISRQDLSSQHHLYSSVMEFLRVWTYLTLLTYVDSWDTV